jgi:hypothetical protein
MRRSTAYRIQTERAIATVEVRGRRTWFADAMNHVQRAAIVGASRERRCQSARGLVWWSIALKGGVVEIAVAT